jgi:hypothetical protein
LPSAPAAPAPSSKVGASSLLFSLSELQQFRNDVAFQERSEIATHILPRMKLREDDIYQYFFSTISDIQSLLEVLTNVELTAIPEVPKVLERIHVSHLAAFSRSALPKHGGP